MDPSNGDLVRLALAGDPVAFRVLVERHLPLARARASRLGADPGDVDDIVQESFLQAFVGLDRLRNPDRFAGWLCGIVLNVHRALHRRAPLMLLADWPEHLHRPGAGCATTSPRTAPISFPPRHGESPWSPFALPTPSRGPGGWAAACSTSIASWSCSPTTWAAGRCRSGCQAWTAIRFGCSWTGRPEKPPWPRSRRN